MDPVTNSLYEQIHEVHHQLGQVDVSDSGVRQLSACVEKMVEIAGTTMNVICQLQEELATVKQDLSTINNRERFEQIDRQLKQVANVVSGLANGALPD